MIGKCYFCLEDFGKASFFHEKAMAGNIEDENSETKKICIERMKHRRFKFKQIAKEYYVKRIVFRKNNDDFTTEHEIYLSSEEEETEIQFKVTDNNAKGNAGKPKGNTDQSIRGQIVKR